jgi:hypothetical protein
MARTSTRASRAAGQTNQAKLPKEPILKFQFQSEQQIWEFESPGSPPMPNANEIVSISGQRYRVRSREFYYVEKQGVEIVFKVDIEP